MDDEFLPIDSYGVIGNDDRCALVGRNGSIDWCCFPHVESPSVFAAILDPEAGGRFAVRPAGEYEASHEYVERTNVLETTFETDDGAVTVTDFMPMAGAEAVRHSKHDSNGDGGEAESTDERFQHAIYRKVEAVSGAVELDVVFEPRFGYGRSTTLLDRTDDGDLVALEDVDDREDRVDVPRNGDEGDWAPTPEDDRTQDHERGVLYLHSTPALDLEIESGGEGGTESENEDDEGEARTERGDGVATATVTVEDGATEWLCLQYGAPNRRSPDEYETLREETIEFWRMWLDNCEESATDIFEFEEKWRDVLVRSALVLKLLIHDETGSIPAAPTTSLPEEIGGELNWDYRYNWIRDAKFTIQALHSVGQTTEAERYFEWFREIGHETPAEIQPLYGLHGESDLEEEYLEHLSGYRDSTPVRIGNAAAEQKQLDIYGTIVQGIYETIRYENGLTDYDWESVRALAEYVCDHWDERGEGIWEFRDLNEHFVHSKLLCWVALDRAIRLADEYDREAPLERWQRERGEIRDAIEQRGYDEDRESFVQFFGADEALDATALLIPIYDFLPADDERVQNTIDTILEELTTDDGLVFRFADSPARPREPGGFVLCSCWLVDALVLSGRIEEANEIFESLLEHTSPLGLLSEMVHADDGTLLGNYPQAFSHIGLLNSAIYLASANDTDQLPPEELERGAASPLFQQHGS
ncbi:glycoside hydrolase family 15 protein [Natronolimnohabitans innermongolicus]|uniref:Glycoside hydrolase 15-like protein n=1 Tax=Natronolimnohabitans innermongolicus JCM 12255 TaxID=1227499 RepID=L9X734_9EURY|nr:glycoside hydrolase family 15 protein [Natronolimnohabitans innermongolicus]ELY57584.1 glycoside hydrolase 15-like protein [Natronolimnohabitans innermongolicus JCM 12255]